MSKRIIKSEFKLRYDSSSEECRYLSAEDNLIRKRNVKRFKKKGQGRIFKKNENTDSDYEISDSNEYLNEESEIESYKTKSSKLSISEYLHETSDNESYKTKSSKLSISESSEYELDIDSVSKDSKLTPPLRPRYGSSRLGPLDKSCKPKNRSKKLKICDSSSDESLVDIYAISPKQSLVQKQKKLPSSRKEKVTKPNKTDSPLTSQEKEKATKLKEPDFNSSSKKIKEFTQNKKCSDTYSNLDHYLSSDESMISCKPKNRNKKLEICDSSSDESLVDIYAISPKQSLIQKQKKLPSSRKEKATKPNKTDSPLTSQEKENPTNFRLSIYLKPKKKTKERIHDSDSDFWKTTSDDSVEIMPKKVDRSKKIPARRPVHRKH